MTNIHVPDVILDYFLSNPHERWEPIFYDMISQLGEISILPSNLAINGNKEAGTLFINVLLQAQGE